MKKRIWGRARLGSAIRVAVAVIVAGAAAALSATSAGGTRHVSRSSSRIATAGGGVSVTVSASPSPASTGYLGQPLASTILVTNNGSRAAKALTLTDTLNGLVPG